MMPLATAVVLLTMAQAPHAPAPATLSPPSTLCQLDAGKLKGEPTRLAWSDDGTQLFLQVAQRDGQGMVTKPRSYIVTVADGTIQSIGATPAWASEYWTWKSNKSAPAAPALTLDVKEDYREVSATSSPMGGAMARGGGADPSSGTTVEDAATHAVQTQKQHVFTLTLKGETVGEFVNQQFLPGYTFGWAAKAPLIAYADTRGRLTIMDSNGAKVGSPNTRNVILPAWSLDGSKVAFVEKTGKNKYELAVVDVKP